MKKWNWKGTMVWLALAAPLLIAAKSFQTDLVFGEPWDTLLFMVIVPMGVQAYRYFQDKTGKEPSRLVVNAIVFVIAAAFTVLAGGFAGLELPAFPVLSDPVVGLGAILTFLAEWSKVLLIAFGSIEAVYVLVLRRVTATIGLAPKSTIKAVEAGK